MSDLLSTPISYRLPWSRMLNAPDWQRAEIVATRFTEGKPSKWAIREAGCVIDRESMMWEYEPTPSSRNDEFFKRTRFDSAEEAAEFARIRWSEIEANEARA